jgi:hypothetical protein
MAHEVLTILVSEFLSPKMMSFLVIEKRNRAQKSDRTSLEKNHKYR